MVSAAASQASSTMESVLNVGIAGLGVGSAMVIPSVEKMPQARLVAAADVRPEALEQFARRYEARTYQTVRELCDDPNVDVIWVATPNQYHCEHVVMAAQAGKHVVCEKPMALSIEQAEQMVEAADKAGVYLLCGHTFSLHPSIQAMRRIVRSGELGRLTQIAHWMYSDWLLKPRLPQELDVNLGGGVVYRHGPHIIDSIRTIGGGMVRSVRAMTGAWMPERPAPGNWSAYIEFEDGTPATVSYSGYGYFNSSDLVWGIGDRLYTEEEAVAARKAFRSGQANDEAAKEQLRETTRTGSWGPSERRAAAGGNWFGIFVISCERGNLRQSPDGLLVYDDKGHHEVPITGDRGTGNVELGELHAALTRGAPIVHHGRWGMATLEVQLAVMQSGRERREIMLTHQCPVVE